MADARAARIRDLVRTLARADRAEDRGVDSSAEFPWDVVELLRENAIFGTLADEEFGGVGASALQTLVRSRVSRSARRAGSSRGAGAGALGLKLAGRGAEAAVPARDLRRETLAAYRADRAGSGSDAAACVRGPPEGDQYILDGSKRFITNAGVAGLYVVFAKTDPGAGHEGISAFVVEGDAPGLEIGRIEPKMGIKGSTTGEVLLTGCRVPAANRLGEEGEGWRLAMRILDRSRPGIAAQALGIAEGATDYALEYARTRETMGEPIANHQLVAGMLADMETRCEAARGLPLPVRRADRLGRKRAGAEKLSAITKLFCSDTAMAVTTDAVQVLGGYTGT